MVCAPVIVRTPNDEPFKMLTKAVELACPGFTTLPTARRFCAASDATASAQSAAVTATIRRMETGEPPH